MELELLQPGTDWDKIYYFIQSSNVSDPRYHSDSFDDQPVTVIRSQVQAIHGRDMTIANVHSITVARCGLIFASSDKLTEKDFLPFPDLFETGGNNSNSSISKSTAKIFMNGVRSGEIPNKVVMAFTSYIDEITALLE